MIGTEPDTSDGVVVPEDTTPKPAAKMTTREFYEEQADAAQETYDAAVTKAPPKKDAISFEALALEDASQNEMMKDIVEEDDEYIDILREYGESRYGEEGMQKEGEADEEYLKRFLSHSPV